MRIAVAVTFVVFLGMAFAATRTPEAQVLVVSGNGVDFRILTLAAGPLPISDQSAH